jgi:hypothetical protein
MSRGSKGIPRRTALLRQGDILLSLKSVIDA